MDIFENSPTRESDRVEQELRQLILTLQIDPGLSVTEASLIQRYGWGRTPLREAFQRLAEQSLLQIVPHHGVVVTPLSIFEFVEVMDVEVLKNYVRRFFFGNEDAVAELRPGGGSEFEVF